MRFALSFLASTLAFTNVAHAQNGGFTPPATRVIPASGSTSAQHDFVRADAYCRRDSANAPSQDARKRIWVSCTCNLLAQSGHRLVLTNVERTFVRLYLADGTEYETGEFNEPAGEHALRC